MRSSLYGDTVYLRAVQPEDAVAVHELLNDPDTHLASAGDEPFVPLSVAYVKAKLEERPTSDRSGMLWFAGVARTDNAVIGMVTMFRISNHNQVAEIGIALHPEARGKGYGLELLTIVCRYGFRMRGLRRIELGTRADNAAMRALAERLGFIQEGVLRERVYDGEGHRDVILYGLLRREWREAQS